jgi:PilZ domain
MPFRLGSPKPFTSPRRESRVPMEVGVQISGHRALPGTETTFTENVSSHGARILSTRRWKRNEQLTISTLTGSFRSLARVAYCQSLADDGFAVGVEFVNSTGTWVRPRSCHHS